MFVLSKALEYAHELRAGFSPVTDTFHTWYFLLTGIHLMHVLLGGVLLLWVWGRARRCRYAPSDRAPELVIIFWHLVDFVWVRLFPLLYLLKAR